MGSRWQRVSKEIGKFAVVNGIATVMAIGLFNLLVHGLGSWFHGPLNQLPTVAYLIANTVGMVISYLGSRKYAFEGREPVGPADGLVNYAVINTMSFALPIGCLWLSRNWLHESGVLADNVSANVVGALLAMGFRFWAFKRFVFRSRPPYVSRLYAHTHESSSVHARSKVWNPSLGPHVARFVTQKGEAPAQRRAQRSVQG